MKVYAGERAVRVYESNVNPPPYISVQKCRYCIVPLKGEETLTVCLEHIPKCVCIRPLSRGISYRLVDDRITVTLSEPCQLSIEIDGDIHDGLLVFAGQVEEDAWRTAYREVRYFHPGEQVQDIIRIERDDTLLYFEEGAYVHGKIVAENRKHIAMAGYGILTMEDYEREARGIYEVCLDIRSCRDVRIQNLTVTDSCSWSCRIMGCESVRIENLKIIGCRGNSDGIDICGSRNVLVKNCFTRTWDDSLVVKALDTGDAENIRFTGCVLWNDFARPMEVGVELRAEHVRNVLFDHIDVIHSLAGYPVMGIHHGDRAEVTRIRFQNIRVEHAPGAQLFDVRITDSVWNRDTRKGCIHDVSFEDIEYIGAPGIQVLPSPPRLQGFDAESCICGVSFRNIRIMGRAVRNARELGLRIMDHVSCVDFAAAAPPYQEPLRSAVEIISPFACGARGLYEGRVRLTLVNEGSTRQTGVCRLEVSPGGTAELPPVSTFDLQAGKSVSTGFALCLQPGKYVLAAQSDHAGVLTDWKLITLDWVLGSDVENACPLAFTDYKGNFYGSVKAAVHGDYLVLESEQLRDHVMTLYVASPVKTEPNQVLFSSEETDFGLAPAVTQGVDGPELAPQLRCPAEINYVFQNEPKVGKIRTYRVGNRMRPVSRIPLDSLGIDPAAGHCWMEIALAVLNHSRYPCTLFRSQCPDQSAHMFANVIWERR